MARVSTSHDSSNTVFQYDVGIGGALAPKSPAGVVAGQGPLSVAVSPDGESVYVANQFSNDVSQYDVGAGGTLSSKSPATVAAGELPYGLAVGPDGESVYVTNQASNNVSQYDVVAGGSLLRKTPATVASGLQPLGVRVTPDGNSAYVANASNETSEGVSQYDVGADGALSPKSPETVSVGFGGPIFVAVSPLVEPPPPRTVTALSPVHGWIGLKNSDDQGTQFDLRVELFDNGTPVASGLRRCVTGVTRNPSRATEVVVPWGAFSPVSLEPDDTLSLRLSTRIGTNPNGTRCSGPGGSHASATGLRLYYDSVSRASRFDATIEPDPNRNLYLHSDGNPCATAESTGVTTRFFDTAAPSAASAKCKDSAPVKFAGGNAFKVVGRWSLGSLP